MMLKNKKKLTRALERACKRNHQTTSRSTGRRNKKMVKVMDIIEQLTSSSRLALHSSSVDRSMT